MKSKFLIPLAAGVGLLGVACSKPRNDLDKASYAIGLQFGRSLKAQGLQVNPDFIGKGVADAMLDKRLLTDQEMQAVMLKMDETHRKAQAEQGDKNKKVTDEFLEKNKSAPGVLTTASGLQYQILDEGKGDPPKASDIVVLSFSGKLTTGLEFDSSRTLRQPAEFHLESVMPGWREGVQLIKKGGKIRLWIPPQLGYGDQARPNIPGNSVLIYEIDLLDFKNPKAKPKVK